MKKEQYVLVIWDEGGIPNIQGLYQNTEETFEYLKQLLLDDIQQWHPEVTIVPHDLETIEELRDWYDDLTELADEFWRIGEISPSETPQMTK